MEDDNKLILEKRDCPIKIELNSNAGWIYVYFYIGKDQLDFHISYVFSSFNDLLRALYFLYPKRDEPNDYDDIIEYKADVPWKAHFKWDEEGSYSQWELERKPNEETDFMLKLNIGIYHGYIIETDLQEHFKEVKRHIYEVKYKDLCYAVARACTIAIKEYGFFGYQYSSYGDDLNLRFFLFLKAVALGCLKVRELTFHKGRKGASSNFKKELKLLLFDM